MLLSLTTKGIMQCLWTLRCVHLSFLLLAGQLETMTDFITLIGWIAIGKGRHGV